MDNATLKTLHTWEISLEKTVEETHEEDRDGQKVKVTREVKKPVITKMALKQPTRREMRQAELFYGKRFNHFMREGFLPSSVITNTHLNITGGVLSNNEKSRLETLRSKHMDLENDLVRAVNESAEVKDKLQKELATVRSELVNLYSINQVVFNQTADRRAERDLNDWLAYHLTLVERGGQWHPYFEGDTFEKKEEHMWKMEEGADELYSAAAEKIATYVQLFQMGYSTTERFKEAEEDLKRELEEKRPKTSVTNTDVPPAPPVDAVPVLPGNAPQGT